MHTLSTPTGREGGTKGFKNIQIGQRFQSEGTCNYRMDIFTKCYNGNVI